MTRRSGLTVRLLADFLVGIGALAGFVLASHSDNPAWLIAIGAVLLVVAGVGGYQEPFAKRVWIHAPIIMLPEVIALPVAALTCRGHGCAGVMAFMALASLFTLVLVGVSYAVFYMRRWSQRAATSGE